MLKMSEGAARVSVAQGGAHASRKFRGGGEGDMHGGSLSYTNLAGTQAQYNRRARHDCCSGSHSGGTVAFIRGAPGTTPRQMVAATAGGCGSHGGQAETVGHRHEQSYRWPAGMRPARSTAVDEVG